MNKLESEIILSYALEKSNNEAKARKRLPGAIVDRLMKSKLQASRSWPGVGKDTKKSDVPPLLTRFIRTLLQKCGEKDIGEKMDKRISVRKCENGTIC